MNELISNIIGIVEKAQETSSGTGMIKCVCMWH